MDGLTRYCNHAAQRLQKNSEHGAAEVQVERQIRLDSKFPSERRSNMARNANPPECFRRLTKSVDEANPVLVSPLPLTSQLCKA